MLFLSDIEIKKAFLSSPLSLDGFIDGKEIIRRELSYQPPNHALHSYNTKVVQCGNVTEVYEYSIPQWKGYENTYKYGRRGYSIDDLSERKDENRSATLTKARKTIRNIVNSNVNQYGNITPKFMTLTFKENITDIDQANKEYRKFIKRLNYHVLGSKKCDLKYTCVSEIQDGSREYIDNEGNKRQGLGRGAIHYHVIFYNLPYVPHADLLKIWGSDNGLRINKIDNVDNVGAYVCAYLTKQGCQAFEGKKVYFNARGLKKPIEITKKNTTSKVLGNLESRKVKCKIEKTYMNDYTGLVTYRQYVDADN